MSRTGQPAGLGEVAGELLDEGGEHDPDGNGDQGEHTRVAAVRGDGAVGDAVQLGVRRGQVDEDGHGHEDERDHGGHEESTVDGAHPAAVGAPGSDGEDPDHRGDHPDRRNDQRKGEPRVPEGGLAQDECGHERHGVRLEEVGCHARAVADVVTHVVGDGGGVAWVVLRDALLDLAHEVGAHVGGLGEDAAADPHEHGNQRGAETEPLQHLGRVGGVDEHHAGGAEQAEAHRDHADHTAGTKSDLHRFVGNGGEIFLRFTLRRSRLTRSGGHAHITADGEPHTDVSGGRREKRTHQEEQRAPRALRPVVGRKQQKQEEDNDGEDADGTQLPGQIGIRAFLDGPRDLFHAFGALVGRQHLAYQQLGHDQCGQGDDRDDNDDQPVAVGEYCGCE